MHQQSSGVEVIGEAVNAPNAPSRNPQQPNGNGSRNQRGQISDLLTMAAEGLGPMFDPERQLFCFTRRQSGQGLLREGLSPRYSMMTLLGLHRWEAAGGKSPIAIQPALDIMMADTNWIQGAGDLGCLLWSCAVLSPERFAELAGKVDAAGALNRYADTAMGSTMELAWLLTGLAHGLNTGLKNVQYLSSAAQAAYRALKANQGANGVFGHSARASSILGSLRRHVGSFADQVYPIYAFSHYAKFSGEQDPLARAEACARMICEYQGPQGEWWWHYNSATGAIAETYPVYSVHQDGMAPMALFALAEVTGKNYTSSIRKGLGWIAGNNDLHFDMRSDSAKLVWRNFFLPGAERYVRQILGLSRKPGQVPVRKLKVNYECRPYELGWALYGLAGRGLD